MDDTELERTFDGALGLIVAGLGLSVPAVGLALGTWAVLLAQPALAATVAVWALGLGMIAGTTFAIGAFLVVIGRGGLPLYYNYDLSVLDLLGSAALTLSAAACAASVGAHVSWPTAGGAALIVGALFGVTTSRGFFAGLAARRVLPSPRDFWPCDAIRSHPPTGPLRDMCTADTVAGQAYGWTVDTNNGPHSVVFIANPELDEGAEAPAGRVFVGRGALAPEDLTEAAERAVGL